MFAVNRFSSSFRVDFQVLSSVDQKRDFQFNFRQPHLQRPSPTILPTRNRRRSCCHLSNGRHQHKLTSASHKL
jgi:hypothetical protein